MEEDQRDDRASFGGIGTLQKSWRGEHDEKAGGIEKLNWNACPGSFSIKASQRYPGYYDLDQLYNLSDDPDERTNLATNPEHAA